MVKLLKRFSVFVLGFLFVTGLLMFCINAYVKSVAEDRILTVQQANELMDIDCILVLGCWVDNGTPSLMLEDRLNRGLELYREGVAPKLLMSGDHGREDYDEVDAMKHYAVDRGVPSEDVFMDHAGFSTYESIYRAKEVFGTKRIVVVTQNYHLPRALYIAQQLGVEAYGVAAKDIAYGGQAVRDLREVLARVKDVGYCLLKPEPTFLGEVIPISGDGEVTHDENSDFSDGMISSVLNTIHRKGALI